MVCGLHWRSPYDFSGMEQGFSLALSYLLLNHSTKATLLFRIYSNLYLLVGYIQEDVLIVLFGMIYFFPGGGTSLYISYFYLTLVIPFPYSKHVITAVCQSCQPVTLHFCATYR